MSANKRLLYFCGDRGIPYGGTKGASIHIREFLASLRTTEYAPTLLISRSFQADSEFPIHTLASESAPNYFHDIAGKHGVAKAALREVDDFNRNELFFAKLAEIYDRERFDIIYERYSLFSIAGLSFARQVKIPFVLEVNAPLVREASQFRSLHLVELAKLVEEHLFNHADHIFAVSEPLVAYIKTVAPAARVSALPNGVDFSRFGNGRVAGVRERITKSPASDFVVGFVGSIKPWHGVELLIETMADLVKTDPSFSLCLVGNADQVKEDLELRAQAQGLSDRLKLLGALPFEEIPAVLDGFDVLVAPYPDLPDFYFSPLKIFEYMAAGKPIIASRIGQISEILHDGETALLTAPGDKQGLAAAIRILKADPQLSLRLGTAAKAAAEREHSWENRLQTAATLFDRLVAKRRAKETVNAD